MCNQHQLEGSRWSTPPPPPPQSSYIGLVCSLDYCCWYYFFSFFVFLNGIVMQFVFDLWIRMSLCLFICPLSRTIIQTKFYLYQWNGFILSIILYKMQRYFTRGFGFFFSFKFSDHYKMYHTYYTIWNLKLSIRLW